MIILLSDAYFKNTITLNLILKKEGKYTTESYIKSNNCSVI